MNFLQAFLVGLSACFNYGGEPVIVNQVYIGCQVSKPVYAAIAKDLQEKNVIFTTGKP
jgi:urea transporter